MRARRFFSILVAGLAVTACSGISFEHDYSPTADFSQFRTVAFHSGSMDIPPGGPSSRQFLEERLRSALVTAVDNNGALEVTDDHDNADLLLVFHAAVGQQMSVSTINTWYGGTWGRGWRGGCGGWGGWHTGVGTTQTRVNTWEEGTLIVDLLANQAGGEVQLVWRGTAQGSIDENATPSERTENLNRVAREIFRSYPPR